MSEQRLWELLDEASDYFGPCWCRPSIGYCCPQCAWETEVAEMKEERADSDRRKP